MLLARATLPEQRRPLLKQLLGERRLLRAIECHDPLSALLGSHAKASEHRHEVQFDVLWASGFAHATSLGLPDSELAALERRVDSMADIAAVTAKPILADADTGGDSLALLTLCRRLEQIGVGGAVVEDKTGAKRTSLANDVHHELEDPHAFVDKLDHAKRGLLSQDFMLFARIESLIAGVGLEDALHRAGIYLRSSADGVVIHSKDRSGAEVLAFAKEYGRLQTALGIDKPLICIPTAYPHITGAELSKSGVGMVIHGNHMIRAAYRAMQLAAHSILENDRALEANTLCAPVDELLKAIGVDSRSVPARRAEASHRGPLIRTANE